MTIISAPTIDILFEELAARGWDLATLAELSGLPLALVTGILDGDESITPHSAMGLARALGTSDTIWLNLNRERAYRTGHRSPT